MFVCKYKYQQTHRAISLLLAQKRCYAVGGTCEVQTCPSRFPMLSTAPVAPPVTSSDGKSWPESPEGVGKSLCMAQGFGGREMLLLSLCLCHSLEGASLGGWARFGARQHELRMPDEISPFAPFPQLPSKHFLREQAKGWDQAQRMTWRAGKGPKCG